MTLCIYHNPRCSKSRETLALLETRQLSPDVVRYLETPPDDNAEVSGHPVRIHLGATADANQGGALQDAGIG